MNLYDAVKQRIFELCDENDITINCLADESGVSRSTLKNILYGRSKDPKISTLKKLCDGVDLPFPQFFDSPLFWDLEQEIQ